MSPTPATVGDISWSLLKEARNRGPPTADVIREPLRLLREKHAESRLQPLRDLLMGGLSSGEPVEQISCLLNRLTEVCGTNA
ncbi:type II toxin-antitoxin system ParD family antitoxin [Salmonella enterica]|nr:type II toxin-antitoxin system ParD family antitoxin [Salmonella enterica subsp. enterica serovar Oranienburg]EHN6734888.1 type II toxin-antitoxin system ParD family antitoxin [Salmonella enterica]EHV4008848.1 type II toxin-antitoxin system ParD family antitoxin [Salmonella enterica]EJF8396248.1 type II toxin-antitoxin system ParD family antitoxin [Salmonella enterica]ELY7285396.1 type II toxin-antitoxin system ParD family antitoxin [Salmonella enterica]